jgi:hypothetical protein
MRLARIQRAEAFTRIELMVVIVVTFGVVLLSLAILTKPRVCCKAKRISCINNLKQIGTAYRIWSNDNGDRFPAMQSVAKGGWNDFLTKPNEGFMCWENYALMSNEMGQSTKVLVCPSDEREAAISFTNFANTNLSYFVGVGSDDTYPQSLLGGDRNLGPGTIPDRQYGYSPENGQGNDVAIQTNSQAGPVCWSLKMHSEGNAAGAGNILLGDGRSQQVNAHYLGSWRRNFNPTTNWPAGHVPSSPSILVLFP